MRSIQTLTPEEVNQLRYIIQNNASTAFQKRCQCILYSYYGMPVSDLMNHFEVDRRSIYNWMNRWEKGGIQALMDQPGRGYKPKLHRSSETWSSR